MPTYTVSISVETGELSSSEVAAEQFIQHLWDVLESNRAYVNVRDDSSGYELTYELEREDDEFLQLGFWNVKGKV
jgi:hypothetical protein